MSDPILQMRGLGHAYSPTSVALAGVDLEVGNGELAVIVGPSGSGKSTLLRAAAGLIAPSEGAVLFRGEVLDGVPDGLSMVFQDYGRSLFPWLRVVANVEFGLARTVPAAERRSRALDMLSAVGLGREADRYPWELSGGMQQRVAIARALVARPVLLLMDEPFGSVDAQTRANLEDLVSALHADLGFTGLVVTHDIDESVYLGDRVLVLSASPGRVVASHRVDLDRPRDQVETRSSTKFAELRRLVAAEVLRR